MCTKFLSLIISLEKRGLLSEKQESTEGEMMEGTDVFPRLFQLIVFVIVGFWHPWSGRSRILRKVV